MGNVNDVEETIEQRPKEAQLLYAAENGRVEKLCALLAEKEVNVDCANSSAVTALFLAAKEGHEECVRLLLESGASVDGIGVVQNALSPLWVATYAGHKNCVQRLVLAGANLNTKFPETPLVIAAREGRADCLKILIEAGGCVNVRNGRGQNPLHIACSEVRETCVELLANTECELDAMDQSGCTPLHHACINAPDGHKSVKVLVQMGADVNISSKSWNHATSLHFCSQDGKSQNVKLLLKYGANVFIKDKCGLTARDRARKHPECEKMLLEQEEKPSRLLHLCCWTLRGVLGTKGLKRVHELPLPHSLQRFLL